MHDAIRPVDGAAERFDDALVPEADSQDRKFVVKLADQLCRDAGILWSPGPGGVPRNPAFRSALVKRTQYWG